MSSHGLALGEDENLSEICADNKSITPFDVGSYKIPGVESDGTIHFYGIDIDGDGLYDDLSIFCPNSASLIPADNCAFSGKLSKGQQLSLDAPRLYLIEYKHKYYLIATDAIDNKGQFTRKVYELLPSGIVNKCKK